MLFRGGGTRHRAASRQTAVEGGNEEPLADRVTEALEEALEGGALWRECLHHVTIRVQDRELSCRFYEDVFLLLFMEIRWCRYQLDLAR